MKVWDAVDPPSTVTGVGYSIQTHLTLGTTEAARMVGVAQTLGRRMGREFRVISTLELYGVIVWNPSKVDTVRTTAACSE